MVCSVLPESSELAGDLPTSLSNGISWRKDAPAQYSYTDLTRESAEVTARIESDFMFGKMINFGWSND